MCVCVWVYVCVCKCVDVFISPRDVLCHYYVLGLYFEFKSLSGRSGNIFNTIITCDSSMIVYKVLVII